MELVIDANIIFSAFIKLGKTSEILFHQDLKLYVPEFFFSEFEKYQKLILDKTHRSRENLEEISESLSDIITVIPKSEFATYLKRAKKISPDPNDVMYLALALKLKCGIWSNDKRLKDQKTVKIYSTKGLIKLLNM